MNTIPKISIIMRTHDRVHYFRRAIESVFKQNFSDFEVIIVNDCSFDATATYIDEYAKKNSRIRVFTNTVKEGLVKALQKGVQNAKGTYVAILDDDDFWCDEKKLAKQIEFLESHREYVAVGSGVTRITSQGKEIARYLLPEHDKDIRNVMLQYNPIANISVLFRKESWEKVGGYNVDLDYSEDWDLWMRFAKIGKLYNLQSYFATYMRNKWSKTPREIRRIAYSNMQLRKKYRKDFPNFFKGYAIGLGSYIFSFLPFQKLLYPLRMLLKKILS